LIKRKSDHHDQVDSTEGPLGFKTFINAARAIAAIELVHRICRPVHAGSEAWMDRPPAYLPQAGRLAEPLQ